jgi:hypothetical protein
MEASFNTPSPPKVDDPTDTLQERTLCATGFREVAASVAHRVGSYTIATHL